MRNHASEWRSFPNNRPGELELDLAIAAAEGITPVAPSATALVRQLANGQTIKWAVNEAGELRVIPKYGPSGSVIAHSTLFGGAPVVAAGEAVLEALDDRPMEVIQFDAHSGHYFPLYDPDEQEQFRSQTCAIARELFAQHGVVVRDDAWYP
jgi:hypothetical protein